jgi:ATP-binding cassette subfamily F protein uup
MALLSLLDVHLAFGGPPILDGVNLQIEEGERVCLVGRNGAGKTTLFRIATGQMRPDSGEVGRSARQALLTQEIPDSLPGTVREIVASGLGPEDASEEDWERDLRVDDLVARLGLPEDSAFDALSGGLKRRCLLARALAAKPELLLLDEPTNHLDLESILWMEEFLLESRIPLFFVTHDRAFLRRMATRIVELGAGQLSNWPCDYDSYLRRKEEAEEAERQRRAAFEKKLAQEEAWSRRSPGAQRKRSEARMEALRRMRSERGAWRQADGTAKMGLGAGDLSGVRVVEAENLGFAYPGQPPVVRGLDLVLRRGDKVGLIGPNGAGKTTLIKLLLGQLAPTEGTVKLGTQLEVTYFDQMRAAIDDSKTVAENVAGGNDSIQVQGRSRHVISYLEDFLFEPSRARSPARMLSGGERNRLLLAKLLAKPANVLVLDEPTNDLDTDTLDVLEQLLVDYPGTLLLVSHDRAFLDNVVTSTLVFEGDGSVTEHVGGYTDWREEVARRAKAPAAKTAPTPRSPNPAPGSSSPAARKLSNKEQRELAELPGRIAALEQEQAELTAQLGDPALYKDGPAKAKELQERLAKAETAHAAALARWLELEG